MTGATPELIVHRDGPLLAQAVAARLVTKLVDVLAAKDEAHLVLTGGTIGIGSLTAVAQLPARVAVDWKRVHLWWGDERFLPAGDKERNETQAREALLDGLELDPARVHPMASTDGPDGANAEAAAERYAAELDRYAPHGDDVPEFDVALFGMGPDGHVASLFPEHPGVYEDGPTVIAVHNSPKPPPDRLSLTFRAIQNSREVALASPRVGAMIGPSAEHADIARAVGYEWTPEGLETLYLRSQVLLACREAGIHALTGLWEDLENLSGLKEFAVRGRQLGFRGMIAIHPSHVATVNEVFTPSAETVAFYEGMVAAYEEAAAAGTGALRYRGLHIDKAHYDKAVEWLERAARLRGTEEETP